MVSLFKFCLNLNSNKKIIIITHQAEDETVQSDDVVLPHHVIQDLNALVQLLTTCRRGKLVHQEIGKRPHVCDESASPDPFQNPAGIKTSMSKSHLNGVFYPDGMKLIKNVLKVWCEHVVNEINQSVLGR